MDNKGFIGWLVLIIIALALLNYFFNWSIFEALSSERGMDTLNYIKEIFATAWSYLKAPVTWLWDRILELIQTR